MTFWTVLHIIFNIIVMIVCTGICIIVVLFLFDLDTGNHDVLRTLFGKDDKDKKK